MSLRPGIGCAQLRVGTTRKRLNVAKTMLVTGGTGFLGKRLGMVLKDDYRVILAGRNNKQNQAAARATNHAARARPIRMPTGAAMSGTNTTRTGN